MAPQSDQPTLMDEDVSEKSRQLQPVKDRAFNLHVGDMYENMRNFDYSVVIWSNVISLIIMHIMAMYGVYLALTGQWKWQTLPLAIVYALMSIIGTTMGAHRLWAHRTYKARFPLRLILATFQTIAWQRDIYDWVRDHRVHHKFSETDADPHNAKRGLFFSHMGWLMCQKHPDVIAQGKKIDFGDVLGDPIVVFQRKNYIKISVVLTVLIPTFLPYYFWNETLKSAFYIAVVFRYISTLHGTWSVNSFAHWVGNRPFNSYIYPAQNKVVAFLTGGEGWHNYHHAFPYDYRAAELAGITNMNYISTLIELCEKVGLAYDLKTPSAEAIEQRAKNIGDGSYKGLGVSN